MTTAPPVPVDVTDPINARILRVSEDCVQGFYRNPLGELAQRCGLPQPLVLERIRAMLQAGTIRRVRQTVITTRLAEGALVAWQVPPDKLGPAFDWMAAQDPFTGHVVIRSTDLAAPGASYKLWTTVKVPPGYSVQRHCEFLQQQTGAVKFCLMPAKKVFALGVGHLRRQGLPPGARADVAAEPMDVAVTSLTDLEWRVLSGLKREFSPEEIVPQLWETRAREAGVGLDTFFQVAEDLARRGLLGRFTTVLDHTKPDESGQPLARFNALFAWAVPPGREIEAGKEVGRHLILTHVYWRDTGPEFGNVNIMAMAHGPDQAGLLAHKRAIDQHLAEAGLPILYTNVFWGGRSQIKPSEILPQAYQAWCTQMGLTADQMRG